MRVLVCGGRDFGDTMEDRCVIAGALYPYKCDDTVIIHGGARGADSYAARWAEIMGVRCEVFPANWTVFGRSAGPRRNQQMLTDGRPDIVIAFPGGRGTADMIARARKAGIEVREVSAASGAAPQYTTPHSPSPVAEKD